MAERIDTHRGQSRQKHSNRRHSYPLLSDRNPDFRRFLYLVECGTLQIPEALTTVSYKQPIQEQGANFEAKKAALEVETKLRLAPEEQEMVVRRMDVFRRPEREENLEVQPVTGPLTKFPVAESESGAVGSLLVTGRCRSMTFNAS